MTLTPSLVYASYLGVYVLLMVGIGIYHAQRIRISEEFLVAGRSVGFWGIVGTIIATNCGAAMFIGFVGQGYTSGIRGLFLWVVPLVEGGVTFALVFARVLRRLRIYTIPDAFALRYGRSTALIASIYQIFVFGIPILALMFWKKSTLAGISWGMAADGSVTLIWHFVGNPVFSGPVLGYGASLLLTVGVSLITDHAEGEQIKAACFEPLDSPD